MKLATGPMHANRAWTIQTPAPRLSSRGGRSARASWLPPPQASNEGSDGAGQMSDSKQSPHFVPPTNRTNTKELTTNSGVGVPNNDHSLSVGPRGPVLLEDFHLQEKLAQFNREPTPSRTVHARGMGAKGYFEVTDCASDVTKADFMNENGKKTPVAVRFSTVTHERDSPESLRDVRGFSVKWYTEEGNWDLVGNNVPVFFIRDGMKFVDLNHALKPNPVTGIQEGWRILDFLAHHPEATHAISWLLDITGIPENWRVLEGHSVNTYTLINKEGKEQLVKFHWLPHGGAKFMNDEEAQMVGMENMRHSHATVDLVTNIQEGNFPKWDFFIQTMDPAKQEDYRFDPLDCTKIWPEDEFPMRKVGVLVLDETVGNIFNEVEQIAFSPSAFVPGITASDDKLLQSRLLAYADAQRYRIGVNYQTLPINMPKCPFHNNADKGHMSMMDKTEEVNYWPSSTEHLGETNHPNPAQFEQGTKSGPMVKEDIPKAQSDPDYDLYQAGDRWRNEISKDEDRAGLFLQHVCSFMSMPKLSQEARNIWIDRWHKVDSGLGERVESQLKEMMSA